MRGWCPPFGTRYRGAIEAKARPTPGSPGDSFRFIRAAHDAALAKAEDKVHKVVRAAFQAQEARALAKLRSVKARRGTRHWDYGPTFDPDLEKKALDPGRVFNVETESDDFSTTVGAAVGDVYESFGEAVASSFGASWDLHDPAVSREILARDNRLRGTVDTTWQAIQQEILDGEAAGESIDDLAKRIGGVFDAAKGYRARMIARTETVGAASAGAFQGAIQSGVVGKKIWLSAHDARTRSSHLSADGQKVGLHEKFQVGAAFMDHPGDTSAPASEVVNCRCTMLFERAEDAPEVAPVEEVDVDQAEIEAICKLATELRDREWKPSETPEREAAIRDLGQKIRTRALRNLPDPEAQRAEMAALREERNRLTVEYHRRIQEFPSSPLSSEEKNRLIREAREAAQAADRAVLKAQEELSATRGRAALDVLRDVREMGTDPKSILWETGSNKAAKALVEEVAEWYPADWWKLSNAKNALQAKIVTGRAYYAERYPEKVKGVVRYVAKLVTNERSKTTTIHELGHRMEDSLADLQRVEMRFWRLRTNDGYGTRLYKYGRKDGSEVVSPDEFADEYMGKNYLGRSRVPRTSGVPGNPYDKEALDKIEFGAAKPGFWEVFTMGMEEMTYNRFGSWDTDLQYIDFILGALAGL